MNEQVTKLLARMASTAEGMSGILWTAKYHAGDEQRLRSNINSMKVIIENLQADLNELKGLEVKKRNG